MGIRNENSELYFVGKLHIYKYTLARGLHIIRNYQTPCWRAL